MLCFLGQKSRSNLCSNSNAHVYRGREILPVPLELSDNRSNLLKTRNVCGENQYRYASVCYDISVIGLRFDKFSVQMVPSRTRTKYFMTCFYFQTDLTVTMDGICHLNVVMTVTTLRHGLLPLVAGSPISADKLAFTKACV